MVSWMAIFLGSFATFRLSNLIMRDDIMLWLRRPFLNEYWDSDEVEVVETTRIQQIIGTLLICHWCVGMWVAAFLTVLHYVFPTAFTILSLLLTFSAISSLLHVAVMNKR